MAFQMLLKRMSVLLREMTENHLNKLRSHAARVSSLIFKHLEMSDRFPWEKKQWLYYRKLESSVTVLCYLYIFLLFGRFRTICITRFYHKYHGETMILLLNTKHYIFITYFQSQPESKTHIRNKTDLLTEKCFLSLSALWNSYSFSKEAHVGGLHTLTIQRKRPKTQTPS